MRPHFAWIGRPGRAARDNAAVSEVAATPLPRRGRLWVILALALALGGLGYALVSISTRKAGRDVVQVEGISDRPGALRRDSPGRRPARIARRAGLDPGLQRPPVRQLPRRLPRHDSRPGRKLRAAGVREAADAPLLGRRKPARARLLRRRSGGAARATAGSTPTSSSATRPRRNGSGSTTTSWPRWPARSANSTCPNGRNTSTANGGSEGRDREEARSRRRPGRPASASAPVMAMIVSGPGGTRTLQDGPSLGQAERAIEAVALRRPAAGRSSLGCAADEA